MPREHVVKKPRQRFMKWILNGQPMVTDMLLVAADQEYGAFIESYMPGHPSPDQLAAFHREFFARNRDLFDQFEDHNPKPQS